MTVLNLSINEDQRNATTGEITDDHFGANLVGPYESVGSEHGWQNADDIAEQVGTTTLRWPGGADAERETTHASGDTDDMLSNYFVSGSDDTPDIFAQVNDSGEWINQDGDTSLREAMEYCAASGRPISVIIPTAPFNGGDISGLEDYVRAIFQIALDTGADLAALEIGNEYWDFSLPWGLGGYGPAAAEVSTVIARVSAEFVVYHADSSIDPDVLIQVRGEGNYGPNNTMETVNDRVYSSFDNNDGDLNNIDGVVGHYYFREGNPLGGTDGAPLDYQDINRQIAELVALSNLWQSETVSDLQFVMSEWNIAPNVTNGTLPNRGLAQIAPVLEIFTAMLENGVDAAQFWSSLYHDSALATAGALQNGERSLNLIGDFMQDFIARVSPSDTDGSYRYVELGVANNDYDVHYFLNDTSHEGLLYLSSITDGTLDHALNLNGLYVIASSVSISIIGSDGVTADYRDYVDLPGYRQPEATMTIDGYNGTLSNIHLDAYEIAVVTFDTYDVIAQTSWNSEYGKRTYLVDADTNDHITGSGTRDWIETGGGQDYIHGGADKDALYSGAGNDIVYAGAGDDYVAGNGGNDVLNGGDGADKIFGGSGDDTIYGGNQYDVIDAGSGNDRVWGGNGRDTVYLGHGDDTFYDNAQNDANGDDIVNGGAGNDEIYIGGGNDSLTGGSGEDLFIFTSSADGQNVITDFELGIDTLEFTGVTSEDLSYVATDSGVRVEWGGSFVKLDGVNINEVDSIDFVFS